MKIEVGQVWEAMDVDLRTNKDVLRVFLVVEKRQGAMRPVTVTLDLLTGEVMDRWEESFATWLRRGKRIA